MAGLSLLCRVQAFSSCGAWVPHCGGFSCCGAWTPEHRNLPRSGIEPVSPALAGRLLTSDRPERPSAILKEALMQTRGSAGHCGVFSLGSRLQPSVSRPPFPFHGNFTQSLLFLSWQLPDVQLYIQWRHQQACSPIKCYKASYHIYSIWMNGEKYICYYSHTQIKTVIIKSLINYFFKKKVKSYWYLWNFKISYRWLVRVSLWDTWIYCLGTMNLTYCYIFCNIIFSGHIRTDNSKIWKPACCWKFMLIAILFFLLISSLSSKG